MIGRRATIGLSLLSALVFCAFAAQSALAVEATKSTFVTCVKDPENKGDFTDAHCDTTGVKGASEYKHVTISGRTNEIAATNQNVTNNTTAPEPAVLTSSVPGGKATITCQKVKNNVAESFIENKEPSEGVMKVSGTIKTEFSECVVTELAKCTVAEPIVSMATLEGLEKLNGPVQPAEKENAMGLRFTGEGESKTFATIKFEGAECSLKAEPLAVTGSVIATSGPTTASSQINKESGATLAFTPEFEMENLKLGINTAKFKTITTPTMSAGNPIALTTF